MFKGRAAITQGLLDTQFELMNVPLSRTTHNCVNKLARPNGLLTGLQSPLITHLVINSTGLKVFGNG